MSIKQQKETTGADPNKNPPTPLNAIIGWIYVLRQSHPNPDLLQEGLDTIERCVRNQVQILDEVVSRKEESDLGKSRKEERSAQGQILQEKGAVPLAGNLARKLEGISVVAVDDDPEARKLLKELLTHCRAIATIVESAGEALKAVEQLHPDVF